MGDDAVDLAALAQCVAGRVQGEHDAGASNVPCLVGVTTREMRFDRGHELLERDGLGAAGGRRGGGMLPLELGNSCTLRLADGVAHVRCSEARTCVSGSVTLHSGSTTVPGTAG